MDQLIVYEDPGFGLVVLGVAVECPLPVELIAEKDVPAGLPYKIIKAAGGPVDSLFRSAWEVDLSSPDGVGADYGDGDPLERRHIVDKNGGLRLLDKSVDVRLVNIALRPGESDKAYQKRIDSLRQGGFYDVIAASDEDAFLVPSGAEVEVVPPPAPVVVSDAAITENVEKARAIVHNIRRAWRDVELAPLDNEEKQVRPQRTAAEIRADKEIILAKHDQIQVDTDAATTADELRGIVKGMVKNFLVTI